MLTGVTGPGQPPLLFLDVDGTLLPAGGPQRPSTLEEWNATWQNAANPHLANLVVEQGSRLFAMPCELMWATAWMSDANKVIAPLMGLPQLPVVDMGELPGIDDPVWSEGDTSAQMNWKTRALVELAAGRPFIWIDDEITDVDRDWVAAHHTGGALLHRVDSRSGLTDADIDAVEAWLHVTEG